MSISYVAYDMLVWMHLFAETVTANILAGLGLRLCWTAIGDLCKRVERDGRSKRRTHLGHFTNKGADVPLNPF